MSRKELHILSQQYLKGYLPDKSKWKPKGRDIRKEKASTYQIGPKQGNDKRDKDTHQLGQNEHEHETQSCQLEKNVID